MKEIFEQSGLKPSDENSRTYKLEVERTSNHFQMFLSKITFFRDRSLRKDVTNLLGANKEQITKYAMANVSDDNT